MTEEERRPVRLNLSKREYIQYTEWCLGMRDFYKSKSDKILSFHGSADGSASVSKILLWFCSLFGYRFLACYPKMMREHLGFGNFLWDDLDTRTSHSSKCRGENFELKVYPCSVENQSLYDVELENE